MQINKIPIKHFTKFKSDLKPYKNKKVAFVHQSFWSMRGGERMIKSYFNELPDTDIFALFGKRKLVNNEFGKLKVKFSILQYIPFIKYLYRYSIPLWPFVFRLWNFKKYDLVISFSSSFAKSIKIEGETKHWAVIMTPPRYLWDHSIEYYKAAYWIRRVPMFLFYTLLRIFDADSAGKPDRLIAISKFTAKRIQKYYGRTPDEIVYPSVDVPKKMWNAGNKNVQNKKDFFLAISPFEENKGGERLFKMAKEVGFKMKVVGSGNLFPEIFRKYKYCKNIYFFKTVDDEQKWELLSNSLGLLMFGIEDLGTIQIEAISVGCPVIAYNKGGVLDTLSDGVNSILIDDVTSDEVNKAILKCNSTNWNLKKMRESVNEFVNLV